eukprot:677712-Prymnesium_polylepis.1
MRKLRSLKHQPTALSASTVYNLYITPLAGRRETPASEEDTEGRQSAERRASVAIPVRLSYNPYPGSGE